MQKKAELAASEAIVPDTPALRETLAALSPGGLLFTAAEKEDRRVWAISGEPTLGGSRLQSDPTVWSRKVRNYTQEIRYMTPRMPSRRRDRGRAP